MRKAFTALLLSILGPLLSAAPAADTVDLIRVWPSYRDAASFTRLGEYFGAAPDATNQAALRTQPAARAGYYWLIRTHTSTAQPGATVQLQVVRAGTPTPVLHHFPLDLAAGNHAVHVGLTGSDWPDAAERPVAWKLEIISSDGTPLATAESYLWAEHAP